MLETAPRPLEYLHLAPTHVAGQFASFDGDEGSDVAELAQAPGGFFGDELAIGEHLEVTVRMRAQQLEQLRMHEWFAAQDPKEGVPVRFGVGHGALEGLQIDGVLLFHIHPATLATEIARVQDREVEER